MALRDSILRLPSRDHGRLLDRARRLDRDRPFYAMERPAPRDEVNLMLHFKLRHYPRSARTRAFHLNLIGLAAPDALVALVEGGCGELRERPRGSVEQKMPNGIFSLCSGHGRELNSDQISHSMG
jgi:hypothetical protein